MLSTKLNFKTDLGKHCCFLTANSTTALNGPTSNRLPVTPVHPVSRIHSHRLQESEGKDQRCSTSKTWIVPIAKAGPVQEQYTRVHLLESFHFFLPVKDGGHVVCVLRHLAGVSMYKVLAADAAVPGRCPVLPTVMFIYAMY